MDRSNVRKRKPAATERRSNEQESEFDAWLDVRLKSLYSSVLNEPVPEDMMKLLQKRTKS